MRLAFMGALRFSVLLGFAAVSTAASASAPNSSYAGADAALRVHGAVGAAELQCAPDGDCGDNWQALVGMLIASGCLGGIFYIVQRARRPPAAHLVSLLVALDASGESIKARLVQLARRAEPESDEGLRQWAQRCCALLLDQHGAWTHAGVYGPVPLLDKRGLAKWHGELGARDRAHHAAYQGTPSYTVVALSIITREPPPPLAAPGHRELSDYLRHLPRLGLLGFEVLGLPRRSRRMTLRELIERYPELFPLDARLSRISHA